MKVIAVPTGSSASACVSAAVTRTQPCELPEGSGQECSAVSAELPP